MSEKQKYHGFYFKPTKTVANQPPVLMYVNNKSVNIYLSLYINGKHLTSTFGLIFVINCKPRIINQTV